MNQPPPTSHQKRIRYLDGWRGISILLVLLGHFAAAIPKLGPELEAVAPLGVELFFVLSGRLMADILFVERFPLGEFYKRRLSRIWPGAAAFVLVTWIALSHTSLAFKPLAVASALTFTINYAMVFGHGVAAIENLWSLCIEEHAYVMLGALAFLIRRRGGSALPFLIIGAALSIADAAVSALILHQPPRAYHWRTDSHVSSIFLASAAYLLLRNRKVPPWAPLVALAGGLIGAVFWSELLRNTLATALLAIAVATLDRTYAPLRAGLSWRPLVQWGMWSYSVYLWQQPFYRLMLDGALTVWLALPLALSVGLVSFYVVENPARRWLNAKVRLGRSPVPAAKGASTVQPAQR